MSELTEKELGEMERLLSAPIFFPQEFKDWLNDFIGKNIPMIPYSHIFGAKLNQAKSADTINAAESTTSSAYVDLTTVGPQATQLVDGSFLLLFGNHVGTAKPLMSPSINASIPSDNDALAGIGGDGNLTSSAFRGVIKEAKNNNQNTIKLQYRTAGGGGPSWSKRWMLLFRIGAG